MKLTVWRSPDGVYWNTLARAKRMAGWSRKDMVAIDPRERKTMRPSHFSGYHDAVSYTVDILNGLAQEELQSRIDAAQERLREMYAIVEDWKEAQ